MRLQYRAAGYIEIHDGLIWRKVRVDNWDRDRQYSLCQHLGFGRNTQFGYTRTNNRDKTAEGDLICYNTHLSGTSCCAYLQPTSPGIFIPHVYCKFGWGFKTLEKCHWDKYYIIV